MKDQEWRIPFAIFSATLWGWFMILPPLFKIQGNPDLYPAWHWMGLGAIGLVLFVVDIWALNSLYNAANAFLTKDETDSDQMR
jgi:hypothetical protein